MPKTLSLKVSIVTEIPRVYEDFFFDEASSLLFGPVAGGGWEGKRKADWQDRLGLGTGELSPATMNVAPNYFQREIEEK